MILKRILFQAADEKEVKESLEIKAEFIPISGKYDL